MESFHLLCDLRYRWESYSESWKYRREELWEDRIQDLVRGFSFRLWEKHLFHYIRREAGEDGWRHSKCLGEEREEEVSIEVSACWESSHVLASSVSQSGEARLSADADKKYDRRENLGRMTFWKSHSGEQERKLYTINTLQKTPTPFQINSAGGSEIQGGAVVSCCPWHSWWHFLSFPALTEISNMN